MTTNDKESAYEKAKKIELEYQEEITFEDIPEISEEVDIFEGLEVENIISSTKSEDADVIEKPCIITDGDILSLYDEVIDNCRQDREQANDLLTQFLDMVMNDGESSSAAKEAIVNLMKTKTDINDKMAKIADLKTRIKLKESDTFPRFLAKNKNQQQNNKTMEDKRDFLKSIESITNKR